MQQKKLLIQTELKAQERHLMLMVVEHLKSADDF